MDTVRAANVNRDEHHVKTAPSISFKTRETSRSGHHKHTTVATLFKTLGLRRLVSGVTKGSGRSNTGRVTVHSKGSTRRYRGVLKGGTLNDFRYIAFTLWYYKEPHTNKMYAAVCSLDGSIRYVPFTRKFKELSFVLTAGYRYLLIFSDAARTGIVRYMESLNRLNGRFGICAVAEFFNGQAKYALAAGTTCTVFLKRIQKYDGYSWIRLPSGKLKRVCVYNQALMGCVLPRRPERLVCTHAGYWRNLGRKPTVRGVVKNPVDHPHGGRAGSVRKPRSPWGWYTK